MVETPRRSLARKSSQKSIPVGEAKQIVLGEIANGSRLAEATSKAQRTIETYRDWMKNDPAFKAEVQRLRAARAETTADERPEIPDFPEFCRDYLFEPLFPHQMRAWQLLNGQEPSGLDPSMQYEHGDDQRIVMNFPPNHGKTVTFSINYVVWRIHMNPGVAIAIVSKSQGYAKKILNGIKAKLTSRKYIDMHAKFAPEGGWRDPDQSWSATMIYVQGKYDGETEKEPTVEAVGMGGAIYGGRFDLIILDDVVDNENAHRYDDQSDWVMTILDSRLPPDGGLMLVLGTRLAPNDLYGSLRKLLNEDDEQFFTYFAQPAVLDYNSDGHGDWLTLWPWQTGAQDAPDAELRCMACYSPACEHDRMVWMKPRWNRKRLAKRRFPLGERRWSLVWQQQQVPDDATFKQEAIRASINRQRKPGVLKASAMGHPENGMNGLYVIGGLDPATVGHTAMMVTALDRFKEKRYVLNGFNRANCTPQAMREAVMRLTDEYKINEWVIERNAFQRFLTQDPELKRFLQGRGCRLTEHYTTANKVDPDFGVMSLAPLFESCGEPPSNGGGGMWRRTPEKALIELPDDKDGQIIPELIKQLIMWEPSGMSQNAKQDLVMALWFTEIAAQRLLGHGRQKMTHLENPFASRRSLRDRSVVNLRDYREAQQA